MSSGGGGNQTTVQSTKVEYPAEEQALRDAVMNSLRGTYQAQQAAGNPYYQKEIPVPVGPSSPTMQGWTAGQTASQQVGATNSALSNLSLGTAGTGARTATGAAGSAQQAVQNLLAAGDINNNPNLAAAIKVAQQPTIDAFQNAGGALSQIRNGAVANGTYGGSRQGIAEGLASQGLADALGATATNLTQNAYTQGLTAQAQAGSISNALYGTGNSAVDNAVRGSAVTSANSLIPAQVLQQIGAQQEGYQQARNNYDASSWQAYNDLPYSNARDLASVLGALSGGAGSTSTGTSPAPRDNSTMQTVGTLGTMAMMAYMMA